MDHRDVGGSLGICSQVLGLETLVTNDLEGGIKVELFKSGLGFSLHEIV